MLASDGKSSKIYIIPRQYCKFIIVRDFAAGMAEGGDATGGITEDGAGQIDGPVEDGAESDEDGAGQIDRPVEDGVESDDNRTVEQQQLCNECGDGLATLFCSKCGTICRECLARHGKLAVYREHGDVISLAEAANEQRDIIPLQRPPISGMHEFEGSPVPVGVVTAQERLRLRAGTMPLPGSPLPHARMPAAVVRLTNSEERVAELEIVKKKIEETCATIASQKISLPQKISDRFQSAHDLLRAREEDLKEKVSELAENKVEILTKQKEKICEAIAALNNVTARQVGGATFDGSSALRDYNYLMMEPCVVADIDFSISLDNIIDKLGDVFYGNKPMLISRIPENPMVFESAEVRFSVKVNVGCCDIKATLSSVSNPAGNVVQAQIRQLEDRIYCAQFVPNNRGHHTLSITVSNQQGNNEEKVDIFVLCNPGQKCIEKFSNFKTPCGIAVTSKDQLVVADRDNDQLAVVDRTSGNILKAMSMSQPYGVTVTVDGTIFACRFHAIEIFSAGGQHNTIGCEGSNPLEFNCPRSIKAIGDKLYVCDTKNCRIQVLDFDGNYLRGFQMSGSTKPYDIASTGGLLYIVGDRDICVYNMEGEFVRKLELQDSPVKHSKIRGICIGHCGSIFITENGSKGVYVYKPSGKYVTTFGLCSEKNTHGGLTVDNDGFVYVCNYSRSCVCVF